MGSNSSALAEMSAPRNTGRNTIDPAELAAQERLLDRANVGNRSAPAGAQNYSINPDAAERSHAVSEALSRQDNRSHARELVGTTPTPEQISTYKAISDSIEGDSPALYSQLVVDNRLNAPETRTQAMNREIGLLARRHANQQFDIDPGAGMSTERTRVELNRIAAQYGDVLAGKDLRQIQSELLTSYQSAFNQQLDSRFETDLSFAKKLYYNAKGLASSAWETLTTKETWIKVADVAKKVGTTIADVAVKLHGAAVDKLAECINNPSEGWRLIKAAGSAVGSFFKGLAEDFGISNIIDGVKQIGAGVVDTFKQGVKTITDLQRDFIGVLRGEVSLQDLGNRLLSNVGSTLSKSWDVIKGAGEVAWGAIKAVGELTGISDLIRAGYHLCRGEFGMAAMYFGFAALSLGSTVLTIATGGLGAPAVLGAMALKAGLKQGVKQVLKAAAKEGFEAIGKEIGEKCLKEVATKLTPEILERAGKTAAEQSIKAVDKLIAKEGVHAATSEAVQAITRKATAEQTAKVLTKAGVEKNVDRLVTDLLEQCSRFRSGPLVKELQELGIEKSAAKVMAKEMRVGVKKGLDKEIKDVLVKSISGRIQDVTERGMQKGFSESWETGVRKLGAKHGISEAQQKSIKEAGERGFKEGVQEGTERVVRRGVEKAFERFRKKEWSDSDADSEPEAKKKQALSPEKIYEASKRPDEIKKRGEEISKSGLFIGRRRNELGEFHAVGEGIETQAARKTNAAAEDGLVPGGSIIGRIGPSSQDIEKRRAA